MLHHGGLLCLLCLLSCLLLLLHLLLLHLLLHLFLLPLLLLLLQFPDFADRDVQLLGVELPIGRRGLSDLKSVTYLTKDEAWKFLAKLDPPRLISIVLIGNDTEEVASMWCYEDD